MEIRFENIINKDCYRVSTCLFDTQPQTAANYGVFFIASGPIEVMAVSESHGTIAGAAAIVTVEKLTTGQAKGSGVSILATAFDLTGVKDTPLLKQASDLTKTNCTMLVGDRLAIKSTGTIAAVKDLCITVTYKLSGMGDYRI